MITFAERFLSITMSYEGKSGYKGYQGETGATQTIKVYTITETKQIKKQGVSAYGQSAIPTSNILGKQPDIVKIEGKLCTVDEIDTYLANLAPYRTVNTIYNAFLPCSILYATSSNCPEVAGQYWLVDMFKIKRNLQKREHILFELVLYKWYGDLPGGN